MSKLNTFYHKTLAFFMSIIKGIQNFWGLNSDRNITPDTSQNTVSNESTFDSSSLRNDLNKLTNTIINTIDEDVSLDDESQYLSEKFSENDYTESYLSTESFQTSIIDKSHKILHETEKTLGLVKNTTTETLFDYSNTDDISDTDSSSRSKNRNSSSI